MRALFGSKHRGNLGDILGTGMCIVIMLTLLTVSIQYMKILTVKRNVEAVARQFLLILETTGELTPTYTALLGDDLRDLGFSTFTITYNRNNSLRDFGEPVTLDLSISASAAELGLTKAAGLMKESYDFTVHLVSISKATPP